MIASRLLRRAILDELRESVPKNLDGYRNGAFRQLLADTSVFFEGTFEIDEEALQNLKTPRFDDLFDVENCQSAYNAIKKLTPYEARDERFWVYLTHTYMLNYSRQRWPIPSDDAEAVSHVRTHFFAKEHRQIERDNAASRLWWMAHLCGRVSGLSLDTSLRVFLYKSDVRASIIERPTVSQNVSLFSALIHNLHQSFNGRHKLFERETFRKLMQEINSVGGAQLLDSMTEQQLVDVVQSITLNRLGVSEL